MESIINDLEYDKLIKRLEFNDTMRNNLLTFSFTAVLAVLGIALEADLDKFRSWVCLLPYFLIIPFAARISYYRLSSAHISSFLRTFVSDKMKFEVGAQEVPEGTTKRYTLIAWLVNHEMVLLGATSSCTFWYKYFISFQIRTFLDCVALVVPVMLILFVFSICDSTNNYGDMLSEYIKGWETCNIEKMDATS